MQVNELRLRSSSEATDSEFEKEEISYLFNSTQSQVLFLKPIQKSFEEDFKVFVASRVSHTGLFCALFSKCEEQRLESSYVMAIQSEEQFIEVQHFQLKKQNRRTIRT